MLIKILLTALALLVGPAVIALTLPFYNWSITGGLLTAMFISSSAAIGVWKKPAASTK